jgi:hypothetical protein
LQIVWIATWWFVPFQEGVGCSQMVECGSKVRWRETTCPECWPAQSMIDMLSTIFEASCMKLVHFWEFPCPLMIMYYIFRARTLFSVEFTDIVQKGPRIANICLISNYILWNAPKICSNLKNSPSKLPFKWLNQPWVS